MRFRKLVLECGIIAASVAVVSAPSAVSVSAAEIVSGTWNAETEQDNSGSSELMQDLQEKSEENATDEAAAAEDSPAEDISEEEFSEWENKLLVVVEEDSSLNIRAEADTSSEVVGKMNRGSVAEVVEKGEEWSRIVSGEVEGYVKNEYCVFAEDAEAQAEEICDTVATVTTDGVRLRSEANTESSICEVLDTGDVLIVWKSEEEADTSAEAEVQEEVAAGTDEQSETQEEVAAGTDEQSEAQEEVAAGTDEQSEAQEAVTSETNTENETTGDISAEENSEADAEDTGWVAVEYGDAVAYISD
ncbi:MAG: SH3 domain-containing protein, partial [Clostridiales bacterium]|nr:SH3 domain-containing protein [Clostridiales bacterium]